MSNKAVPLRLGVPLLSAHALDQVHSRPGPAVTSLLCPCPAMFTTTTTPLPPSSLAAANYRLLYEEKESGRQARLAAVKVCAGGGDQQAFVQQVIAEDLLCCTWPGDAQTKAWPLATTLHHARTGCAARTRLSRVSGSTAARGRRTCCHRQSVCAAAAHALACQAPGAAAAKQVLRPRRRPRRSWAARVSGWHTVLW